MKILFLNTNIGYAGASKIMVWLANLLVKEGHDVTFLTYRDSKENQILDQNILHEHFSTNSRIKKILFIFKLHRFIKKQKFDLAIAFLTPSQIRLAASCILTSTKTLFSQRGDPYVRLPGIRNLIAKKICDLFFLFASKYVFQTNQAAQYYPSFIQKKGLVIPNAIHKLERTAARNPNYIEKKIVCVARLDIQQKRQDILIKAFNKVCLKHPEYTLHLIGDGYSKDEFTLKELAQNNKNILFKGASKNIISEIQNAAIAVLTSDFEGIPNALLEYMSLGIPCISTNCSPGGAAMLIKNQKTGILVPRGDINALAQAINFMIENPQKAEEMGSKATYVNTHFSSDVIFEQWKKIINS